MLDEKLKKFTIRTPQHTAGAEFGAGIRRLRNKTAG